MIEIISYWALTTTLFFAAAALLVFLRRNGVRASVITALLLFVSGSNVSADTPTTMAHPAGQVAEKLNQAITAGDVEQIKILLAPDVLIFESGNVESSLAEYESHHMQSDITFMKAMNVEVESRQVFDSGDTAIVVTRSRIHGMYKEQELDLSSTETLLMMNMGGQWKIIHIHWSSS